MALPREYTQQSCSVARALEVVGERWSLLIVRDAFFGVRRFSDFSAHLRIPRAVLAERLDFLVGEGVLERGTGTRPVYALTAKGLGLWPVVRTLAEWGDTHYGPRGPRRLFTHAGCGGAVDPVGSCSACGQGVPVGDTVMSPGPGFEAPGEGANAVSVALASPHRLLQPLR
ncbi:MAG: helix-turn-helix transcriptional regulator [Pseudonocardia sp.]|nr:helix-turn-helix transcriptional regulator [Pseudonocardia sp.]